MGSNSKQNATNFTLTKRENDTIHGPSKSHSKTISIMDEFYRKRMFRGQQHSARESLKEDPNILNCVANLEKFSEVVSKDPVLSREILKKILAYMPTVNYMLTKWTDTRGMDILQLCIVFNYPALVRLILDQDALFPEDHTPRCNPYAHLAAVLGHLEVLEELLNKRPRFYFKTSKSEHVIKIHKDIASMIRFKDSLGNVKKYVEKLMRKIMENSNKTDRSWLMREIKSLESEPVNSYKELKQHGQVRHLSAMSFESTQSASRDLKSLLLGSANNAPQKENVQEPVSCVGRKRQTHTIYYRPEAFYYFCDLPEGIVRGAGSLVKMLGPEDIESANATVLPKLQDVRIIKSNIHAKRSHCTSSHSIEQVLDESETSQRGKSRRDTYSSSMGTSDFNSMNLKNRSHNNKTRELRHAPQNKVAWTPGNESNSNIRTSMGSNMSKSNSGMFKKIEMGVRTIKKYKDFQVTLDSRLLTFKDDKYMNKTPLHLAAERGHKDCVKYLLQNFLPKVHLQFSPNNLLSLATKAQSPESIAVFLSDKYTPHDYQSAILIALREYYPTCLIVLLNAESKPFDRENLFDGENLLHVLFSQSLASDYRYDLMPEMTMTLIGCHVSANATNAKCYHPMYTLISCTFNVNVGRQFLYYLACLKILLAAKANPHYNEIAQFSLAGHVKGRALNLSRPPYASALHCIFSCAERSYQFSDNPSWIKNLTAKFIECIVVHDKTPRRIQNEVLFTYMYHVTTLGLDRRILRSLFRYGANPDFKHEDKYAINAFFDEMMPFMARFEFDKELGQIVDGLMMICQQMSHGSLQEAFSIFLRDHLSRCPLQAVPLIHRFCYAVDMDIKSPRTLVKLTTNCIWKLIRRSSDRAKKLPVNTEFLWKILPS